MKIYPSIFKSTIAIFMCSWLAPLLALDFPASGETWVTQGTPDKPYGTESLDHFNVLNDGGSPGSKGKDTYALLRFQIGDFKEDAVGSAKLILNSMTEVAHDFEVFGIPDGTGDENFEEWDLTFESSAHASTTLEGSLDPSGLKRLGSFSVPEEPGMVEFSSPILVEFLNADENGMITLIIYRTSQSGTPSQFASSKVSNENVVLLLEP